MTTIAELTLRLTVIVLISFGCFSFGKIKSIVDKFRNSHGPGFQREEKLTLSLHLHVAYWVQCVLKWKIAVKDNG